MNTDLLTALAYWADRLPSDSPIRPASILSEAEVRKLYDEWERVGRLLDLMLDGQEPGRMPMERNQ